MMNLLDDSPLEALTFNYLSFGLVTVINNLWTWLAVITAAISFWKIRASSPFPKPESLLPPPPPDSRRLPDRSDPLPGGSDPDAAVSEPSPRLSCVPRVSAAAAAGAGDGGGDVDVDGVTKRKFTVYYDDVELRESEGDLTVTDEWGGRGGGGRSDGCDEWWERWERLLRLRVGENENGWYTCQDLTALNGDVVRFWDGGFTGELRI